MNLEEYNVFKDIVIFVDPFFGNITIDDGLNTINECIKSQEKFEDVVYDILQNTDYEEEDIASLFSLSMLKVIKFYIDMIQSNL